MTIANLNEYTYIITYPSLVSFCSNQYPFNIETFLQASLMVYGWMPTSLKLKGDVQNSISAINKLIEIKSPSEKLLNEARGAINNSVVGLSKLLHFSNPNVFPIWDSKIAKLQFNIKQHQYNEPEPYIEYFNFVHRTINSGKIDKIREFSESRIPYNVTDVRAIEYYIFSGNRIGDSY